ncbi:MAG: insulinase family protein [Candidatus Omnitrophica bacterium]|nr:insulinase family protein [Candidatus Omnitrophota bacterium]
MYKKEVLKNGLRLCTHDMKGRESLSVGLWVGAGGRFEDDKLKGAAHFLEHILFKGSKRYSCSEIKEQIEGVGGSLNAFTAEENTCYYAKFPSKHVVRVLDILADMVFYPSISKSDVERERGVILEEIKMYHDLPQYFVLELLDGLVWPGHALGKNLAGTQESISKITHTDLKGFHKKYYSPQNIVVSACGCLDHNQVFSLIEKKSKGIFNQEQPGFIGADNVQIGPKVKFYRKQIEQMHLAMGMFGYEYDHKDKYALNLLSIILGGNMSSRLFNEVREKRGLAYSIGSCTKSLKDTGMFMIRAGVDNLNIVDAASLIIKELGKIKKKGVVKDEFVRTKDYLLGQIVMGLEDTLEHMLWMGESLSSRNRIRRLQEVKQAVQKIKMADIKRVAQDVLRESHYNLAIVGPLNDQQEGQLKGLLKV